MFRVVIRSKTLDNLLHILLRVTEGHDVYLTRDFATPINITEVAVASG